MGKDHSISFFSDENPFDLSVLIRLRCMSCNSELKRKVTLKESMKSHQNHSSYLKSTTDDLEKELRKIRCSE